ncbi:MAG: cobyrinate a,c-diamide synthase [Deltaproteobacteria bacterium]|nr:cobyrinate a,c-diamide synthase [Deltaproteobacteria bacterium]
MSCPRLVVAALRGGGGKTTISLGLTAAWRRQGCRVIPFKKGPDYIDAGWLAQAAGRPCFNLDTYMMPLERILGSLAKRSSQNSCLCLIEGNRGLYDGTDESGTHSTAELAKLVHAPVILVVDCTKVTRTLAAIILGLMHFDPDVSICGVVLNHVATARQEALVRSTIEQYTGLPVLGAVPRIRGKNLPERHLGLVPVQEHPETRRVCEMLADLAEKHIDLDRLREMAGKAQPISAPASLWPEPAPEQRGKVKIGVIRDAAFQFYYPENLEYLERIGAELITFSALSGNTLPEVDGLYLGGGFPETHAELLSGNQNLRKAILKAGEEGLPIYAECGGLVYLGRELIYKDKKYPMTGFFPVTFGLETRPQGHGYTILEAVEANPFFPAGQELVGHEFHYSHPLDYDSDRVNLALKVKRGYGFDRGMDGLTRQNVLGTYTHLHALGNTVWAEALVKRAAEFRADRTSKREGQGHVP